MMRVHNTQTNEIIDREMNDDEFADYQADQLKDQAKAAQAAANAAAKSALLEKLGISEDEAKLLLS